MEEFFETVVDRDRAEVGRLLNCDSDEVALCESTGAALNIVLWGLDLGAGDEILAGSLENPAATVPLRILAARRGVRISRVDLGNGDVDATAAFERALSPATKLMLVSDVDFATGGRVDLAAISRLAHAHGVFLLADGIQAAGVCPIDVRELAVDAYAIARHKFLCGPDGAGALYVRPEALPRLEPTFAGVFADVDHGRLPKLRIFNDVRRFDVSTRPVPVLAGATAALRWLREDIGFEEIYRRTESAYQALWQLLSQIKGVRLLSAPTQSSGLITFAVADRAPEQVVMALARRKIYGRTILVTDPVSVRLSVGFWSRPTDHERVAEAVGDLCASTA